MKLLKSPRLARAQEFVVFRGSLPEPGWRMKTSPAIVKKSSMNTWTMHYSYDCRAYSWKIIEIQTTFDMCGWVGHTYRYSTYIEALKIWWKKTALLLFQELLLNTVLCKLNQRGFETLINSDLIWYAVWSKYSGYDIVQESQIKLMRGTLNYSVIIANSWGAHNETTPLILRQRNEIYWE